MAVERADILQNLVKITGTNYLHQVQTSVFIYGNIKTAYHVAGKIVLNRLVEQLILLSRIRMIGEYEHELRISFIVELMGRNGVIVTRHRKTP